MTKGAFVSQRQLDSAVLDVQAELGRAGLWNEGSRLLQVDVIWCRWPQYVAHDALGFFTHGTWPLAKLFGYKTGHIYIPSYVFGVWERSLRNLIRHEYGHAVAHYYPQLIQRSGWFADAFGDCYSRGYPLPEWQRHPRNFVSKYAATEPAEDFAETFRLFLRRAGKHRATDSRAIRKKWSFIAAAVRAIGEGRSRWLSSWTSVRSRMR